MNGHNMKETNLALAGAAMPALADPSSIAAVVPQGKLVEATQLLDVQLKLHLLTAEHLVLSDGFLYDNPAIWALLDSTLLDGFVDPRRDNKSTLIVQVSDVEARNESKYNFDILFRTWAFGEDQKRHLEPSAARLLGIDKSTIIQGIGKLNKVHTTLEDYAKNLGINELSRASKQIQFLVSNCRREPKPKNRHEVFDQLIRKFTRGLQDYSMVGQLDSWGTLFNDIETLASILSEITPPVSRSKIEAKNSSLWWRLAPYLNHFRLSCYFPRHSGSATTSYLPSSVGDAVRNLLVKMEQTKKDVPKWTIALEKLSFNDIFKLRTHTALRNALEKLAVLENVNNDNVYSQYCDVLHSEWAPALEDGINNFASHCIVQEPVKNANWIAPTSGAVGFAAGAATYLAIGATVPSVFSLVMAGTTCVTYLSILSARKIFSHFRVDTPKKAAHLVTTKVLEYFEDSK